MNMIMQRPRRPGKALAPNQLANYDFINADILTVNGRGDIAQMLTYTRASEVLMLNAQGSYDGFAANVPAQNGFGLKISPKVTNLIESSGFAGAAIGLLSGSGNLPDGWTTGGWTSVEILDIGVEYGFPCLTLRVIKNNSSGGSASYPAIYAPLITSFGTGDTITYSMFYEVISGTAYLDKFESQLRVTGSDGNTYAGSVNSILSGGLQRTQITRTIARTDPISIQTRLIKSTLPVGENIDLSLKIFAPQLELGTYANAPVITQSGIYGASDAVICYDDTSGYDLSDGSAYCEFDWLNDGNDLYNGLISPAIGHNKLYLSWAGTALKLFLNGALITTSSLAAAGIDLNKLYFGNALAANQVNMNVTNAGLYEVAKSDADCITETTL